MKREYVFVLQDLVDEDEVPKVRVFTKAKLAAERLVSFIDGHGLTNEEGEELDMGHVLGWRAKDELEAWDGEGRVLYRLYRVAVDE